MRIVRSVAVLGLTAAVAVALLSAAFVAVRGLGGEVPGDVRTAPSPVEQAALTGGVHEVTIARSTHQDFDDVQVVDSLPPAAVLRVRVVGFDAYQRATARQCRTVGGRTDCGNLLPVQFGADGTAEFQYVVRADFAPGGPDGDPAGTCGLGDPVCLVVVTSLDTRHRAELQTLFGAAMKRPGTATVTPAGPYEEGQVVTVHVEGLPPGTTAQVTTCAAPTVSDPGRCGAPAPVATLVTGPDGTGDAQLTVTRGPVGTRQLPCDHDHACALVVVTEAAGVRVPAVGLQFAALPGAVYDRVRLTMGLLVAAVLLSGAAILIRGTDWAPVGEAAAPEIDEAVLADLDAIIAALGPESEDRPVAG